MLAFFAAVRRMIAGMNPVVMVNKIVHEQIEKEFISRLREQMDKEQDVSKKDDISKTIEAWKTHTDDTTMEGKFWGKSFLKQVVIARSRFYRQHPKEQEIEDAIADLISDMFSKERFAGIFKKFDPANGPSGFAKYWTAIIRDTAVNYFRDQIRRDRYYEQNVPEGTRGDGQEVGLEGIRAPREESDLDVQELEELQDDMKRYLRMRFKDDEVALSIYDRWMGKILDDGPEHITVGKDILEPILAELKDKGEEVSYSTLASRWKDIQKAIVEFLEKIEKKRVSDRVKRNLRLAERVAYDEFRSRFASWMLELYRLAHSK